MQVDFTLNQLIDIFEKFFTAHKQVRTFHYEIASEINAKTIRYPLASCVLSDSNISENTINLNFNFMVLDTLKADRTNLRNVQSDMQLIALEFIAALRKVVPDVMQTENIQMIVVDEKLNDDSVAGVIIQIPMTQFFYNDYCSIPLDDSFDITPQN